MTEKEKASIIIKNMELNGVLPIILREQPEKLELAIEEGLKEIEEIEPTRTLKEVQMIVDGVRAGYQVCVDYADTEEDNEYVYKQTW